METILPVLFLCPFLLLTTVISEHDKECGRPELPANVQVEGLHKYFSPGSELVLSCKPGYRRLFGPHKIVCSVSGQWTKTRMMCTRRWCPFPDELLHGDVYYEDVFYQCTVNYTCHEGYVMIGSSTAECLANGTWSAAVPECKPVTCGLPEIPEFGMIIYNKQIKGNITDFGVTGTYECHPPYVVIGNARAECTQDGTWTKPPKCQVVTCPPPENIDHGYISSNHQREYDYMEKVSYGCHGDYVLEGILHTVCQKNGNWSEKPSCKAPCSVGIHRGRILYKGQRLWIKELNPNKVLHKDLVSVYCLDTSRHCGYAVPTQCIDGNLKIPPCFEEPSDFTYKFHSSLLPSEIEQC
ncbi:beta-2-glycoprotein 1-like [Thalassophryne amazonica]|uniref:beta-2-glycoprotein 1-like n=1 Tax=Thalassophryne amazonica TaxID=390379 RepID=UPI001471E8B5|nr:beta-2-glycoprotein 1-like [Thalassophryne amazonica]